MYQINLRQWTIFGTVAERCGQMVKTFLIRIREVQGSNFGPDIGHPE
jgi:hypothetical protein